MGDEGALMGFGFDEEIDPQLDAPSVIAAGNACKVARAAALAAGARVSEAYDAVNAEVLAELRQRAAEVERMRQRQLDAEEAQAKLQAAAQAKLERQLPPLSPLRLPSGAGADPRAAIDAAANAKPLTLLEEAKMIAAAQVKTAVATVKTPAKARVHLDGEEEEKDGGLGSSMPGRQIGAAAVSASPSEVAKAAARAAKLSVSDAYATIDAEVSREMQQRDDELKRMHQRQAKRTPSKPKVYVDN